LSKARLLPEALEYSWRTDHDLVTAVQRGEDEAFEQLFSRYRRRIWSYASGIIGDADQAEDVTQEVFISVLRRMRDTERPIVFKPWVYQIAKNACIDELRRTRRSHEVPFEQERGSEDETGDLVSNAPPPDLAVESKQQAVPRPAPSGRGVRGADQRPSLRAHPRRDRYLGRPHAPPPRGARDAQAGPASGPLPAVPAPRCAVAHCRRAARAYPRRRPVALGGADHAGEPAAARRRGGDPRRARIGFTRGGVIAGGRRGRPRYPGLWDTGIHSGRGAAW
jgi:RNA polymerase sigma factor (sigma-70 family)